MAERIMKVALIGAGMFGGDVHLRAFADLQRSGLSGFLARLGEDEYCRPLADVAFVLVAVATRSEASGQRAAAEYERLTGQRPAAFYGEKPWNDVLAAHPDLDMLAVATPDNLHTEPVLAALEASCHVIVEKPMCLDIREADRIIETANARQRVVCVDMHKRYDPDHMRIKNDIRERIGEPLYGTAILEEPLEVSTSTFKWAEQSDPFTYVGPHWTDLFHYYYGAKPVGLTAVGQKKRLVRDGINAYDAVQVRVDWDNGMSITFQNNWITPPDFEGPVNQGHEIVGTDGKVESDQQYRGFRFWHAGGGSRTANNHFTRNVPRPDGSGAYIGYGTDSIHIGMLAACRIKFLGETLAQVKPSFPTPEEARITVAIIHAARLVRDGNFAYQQQGKAPAVSASFGPDGIAILDPYRAKEGPEAVIEYIYDRPL
ncbi:MAG TPA: Gfo/Idh/MocA family oxidoreductase [Chthonomonadaceae bacterium]|nr:Gfo/Idh/MocA family oxidoreductase [Chthonomonadaceae bacterium]